MDSLLDYRNFDVLKSGLSDQTLRNNIRLLCVFGCGAAEVIYATDEDRVYCYGRNRFGGLGLGVINTELKTPQLNATLSGKQVTNIIIGFEHWMALTASGQCYAWGHNDQGQLGIGSMGSTATPQLIETLAEQVITEVSSGGFHTLALTSNGQVYSWGDNRFGQIGDNSYKNRRTPVLISLNEVISISCGKKHSLALTVSGQVYVWGINGYGQCGRSHIKFESICRPHVIPDLKTIKISKAICGPNHTLLLTTDGYIYAFGENTVGQVGDGTVEHQWAAVRIGDDLKFKDIVSNKENDLSIAISAQNRFYVWGLAHNRRYTSPKEVQTDSTVDTIFDVYAKYAKNKITFKSIEINPSISECEPKTSLSISDQMIQFEKEVEESNQLNDSLNEDIEYSNSCKRGHPVINTRKTIDSVLNLDHFLKNKSLIDDNMRKSIRLLYVFGIYGSKVIFATKDDKVYAFGHNRDGCLGIGATREHILHLVPNKELSGKFLIDISSGYEHCIGLVASGQCYGWGVNKYGQLGIGNTDNQTSPKLIEELTDRKVVQISCGSYHSMALTSDGELFSWGHNTFAQLGDRTYNSREIPTQVLISETITSISSGINHSLALTSTGHVYVWGVNESGQLGRERHHDLRKGRDKAMSNRPKLIPDLENTEFIKAVCGPNHSILLTTKGQIYLFGDNSNGQIGNGTTNHQTSPFLLSKKVKIKDIVTCFRDDLSIAVTTDNKCYVWGLAMDEKVLTPRPVPPSFGMSLFDIYVKLAKNKVTFKAVNVEQNNNNLIEIKESINPGISQMNSISSEDFNNFEDSGDLSDNHNDMYSKGDDLIVTANGSRKTSNSSNSSYSYVNTIGVLRSELRAGELFLKHLHKSFNSPNNYDLIISSGAQLIYCHKTIIQIRNEKFWKLLNPRLDVQHLCQIPINPDSFQSFYAFLQYLYGIEPQIEVNIVADLEKMAEFFEEPELKDLCKEKYENLNTAIDVQNVCSFYEIAINNQLIDLEKSCLEFAATNWKTILRSDAFQAMDDSLSKRLILSIHN